MKTHTKITLLCTAIVVGIISIVVIISASVTSFLIQKAGPSGMPLKLLILFLTGLILAGGIITWLLSRKFASRLIEYINEATHYSEKTFISSASHELNNPLTAIQGECEITLLKERTPMEYQIALQRIESETKRIIQLMKHLLFLSYGEEEILNNAVEPIALADFLMRFVRNRVSFSPDNFAFFVNANPNLLKIAIGNLINNALKYSGEKPVEMRLVNNVLEIKDHGIGIPSEDLKHIAQPFVRAKNARDFTGHGVGLSLSVRILNVYGAKVTITSVPNEGTSISIEFP